MQMVARASGL